MPKYTFLYPYAYSLYGTIERTITKKKIVMEQKRWWKTADPTTTRRRRRLRGGGEIQKRQEQRRAVYFNIAVYKPFFLLRYLVIVMFIMCTVHTYYLRIHCVRGGGVNAIDCRHPYNWDRSRKGKLQINITNHHNIRERVYYAAVRISLGDPEL